MIQLTSNTGGSNYQPSEIDIYNLQVDQFIIPSDKKLITATAVKIFYDQAAQKQWTVDKFNQEAQSFNSKHGFLIKLKGGNGAVPSNKTVTATPQQSLYIQLPMLDAKAKNITMQKYRAFVKKYNAELKFQKANDPSIKTPTVKANLSLTFQSILGLYTEKLKTRNIYLYQIGASTAINAYAAPHIELNNLKLSQFNDVARKTIYNHITILKQAGILTDYEFRGVEAPYKVRISPEILTLTDAKTSPEIGKTRVTENQAVKNENNPILLKQVHVQEAFLLKKDKKKELQNNSCERKIDAVAASTNQNVDFYRNTYPVEAKDLNHSSPGAGGVFSVDGAILNPQPTSEPSTYKKTSQNLQNTILPKKELAVKMSERAFETYTGIRYDVLKTEIMYGNLTRADFRQLMIQEFWKAASKIYKLRKQGIVPGLWMRTLNAYSEKLFKTHNGFEMNKETMLDQLEEFRFRIGIAQKLFRKYGMEPMIPTMYFDPTRKDSKDLSFAGTKSHWNTHLKWHQDNEKAAKKRLSDAEARTAKNSGIRKAERYVNQFLAGKISEMELMEKAQRNIDKNILLQLPGLVYKLRSKTHA